MRVIIKDKSTEVAEWAARHIVDEINAKEAKTDAPFVLGLPTGSTPLETYRELIRLYQAGEVSFKNVVTFNILTGMARGTDLWAAEIVLALRKRNTKLKLICAVPYEGFELRWSEHWQNRYRQILTEADLVKVIGNGYHPGVFQFRNEWMVDRSSRVIAVYNGQPGGTRNTICYADRHSIPVRSIDG